jgi:SAM-dependent methyltransferase
MRSCPVCSSEFANFLPLASHYFEMLNGLNVSYSLEDFETLNTGQYSCPRCAASDRDRLYALFVKTFLMRPQGRPLRILDIAPAPVLSQFLRGIPDIQYRSADLFSPLADDIVDIMDMNIYADNTFDFVVCSHVLEHVPDDRKAIAELYRVLDKNGVAILMVPILLTAMDTEEDPYETDVNVRWTRFGQDDHVRMYAKHDYMSRIREGRFELLELNSRSFGEGIFKQHGITEQSVLYIGAK